MRRGALDNSAKKRIDRLRHVMACQRRVPQTLDRAERSLRPEHALPDEKTAVLGWAARAVDSAGRSARGGSGGLGHNSLQLAHITRAQLSPELPRALEDRL